MMLVHTNIKDQRILIHIISKRDRNTKRSSIKALLKGRLSVESVCELFESGTM